MALHDYLVDGNKHIDIAKLPTDGKKDNIKKEDKAEILKKTAKNLARMQELQGKLYADGQEGIVIVLQAMDAAGKDSTIKHVMSGVNPQGVSVTSFKQPSSEELAHDYLWRINKALPRRGQMAIFNRSYYEDVLVVKVHQLQKNYNMAPRTLKDDDFFQKRYRQIRNYEEYLYENSYRIVKIFLHVSPEEQKKRFLERIDDETKNWKFSASDLKERAFWDDYMRVYEDAINDTASEHSPWYVLPADQKWYTRYLVSELIVDTLCACKSKYPQLPQEDLDDLAACKAQLLAEYEKGEKPKKDAKPAEKSAPKPEKQLVKTTRAKTVKKENS
ncbi:MAG: polyphosphate kinase 2 family protein [Ruthenibacterium sp.]